MSIDVLLQGESIPDIELLSLDGPATGRTLLALAAGRCLDKQAVGDLILFFEDDDEPVPPTALIGPHPPGRPHRLHVHSRRRIDVHTAYNGERRWASFPPSTTIGAAKKWIAEEELGMQPVDAAEHVLQIARSNERPDPDTHVGAIRCDRRGGLEFDLVPLTRIEG